MRTTLKCRARGQHEVAPDGGISCGNRPVCMSMLTFEVNRVIGVTAAEIHAEA